MKLTGKCREEFERWYRKEYLETNWDLNPFPWIALMVFYIDTVQEQWGVYLEFFDSVDINIISDRECIDFDNIEYGYYISLRSGHRFKEYCQTRKGSMIMAIEKADEIFNSSG